MTELGSLLLSSGIALVAAVFFLFPTVVAVCGRFAPRPVPGHGQPRLTMIVALSQAGPLLDRKVQDFLTADYPSERIELILCGDGPVPELATAASASGDSRVRVLSTDAAEGKAYALELGARAARGDILVFSDLDARLAPGALAALSRWFDDPTVGGVCGQRRLETDTGTATRGQAFYVDVDGWLKSAENRLGSISSSDGKLYAIRRELFEPIHPAATDDLYNALSVILRGRRFLFEAEAIAYIPTPSRSPAHELERRRRIVTRSFTGLFARPEVFRISNQGRFGLRLLINKVGRRLVPLALLAVLAGTLLLAPGSPWTAALALLQLGFYAGSGLYGLAEGRAFTRLLPRRLARLWQIAFYFCLGMLGTLLGVCDFVRGRRVTRWVPKKA